MERADRKRLQAERDDASLQAERADEVPAGGKTAASNDDGKSAAESMLGITLTAEEKEKLGPILADVEKLAEDMKRLCSSAELKVLCEKAETLAASSVRFFRHGQQIYDKAKQFKAIHSDIKSLATKVLNARDGSSREEVSTDDGS